MHRRRRTAAFLAAVTLATGVWQMVEAAEITLLCPPSLRPVMAEVVPHFERASGHRVAVAYELMPPLSRRIEAGASFDVAILTAELIERAVAQGRVEQRSAIALGRTGVGMAVRKGAVRPDIGTVEGFKQALRQAQTIGHTADGAAGNAFLAMLERIGIASEVKPKLRPLPGGRAVEPVARGEVDVTVTTIPGILEVPGVDLVAALPDEIQSWITYAAGASTVTASRDGAAALLQSLTSREARSTLRANGVEPIGP